MVLCKACGKAELKSFLNLGNLPLGNAFLTKEQLDQAEERFPLELGYCTACTLVQQISPPPVSSLAKDYRNYRYVPVGKILEDHYRELGIGIYNDFHLKKDSFVIDIGSNNGLLLSSIKHLCKVIGIEPAIEISEIARQKGVPTITDFFDAELAKKISMSYGLVDIVTTTQTLQHIPNLWDFFTGVHYLLKAKGVLIIEGRYIADTIRKFSYDTFYHEMLYFFSLHSLRDLVNLFDMEVFRAEVTDVYGGSLRVYVKRKPYIIKISNSVLDILADELSLGLDGFLSYEIWAQRVFTKANELRSLISQLKAEGKTIAGYGAPSTSCTLLNYCSIGKEHINYIVDDSPLKQGLYAPGTHIPIVSRSMLLDAPPDYLLILAWRLKDDILSKIEPLRKAGMKVIIPLPELEVI